MRSISRPAAAIVAGAIGDRRLPQTQGLRCRDRRHRAGIALARQNVEHDIGGMDAAGEGDFHNNGREYRPQGSPEEVRVHDFLIKELGRAVPYGVHDLAANAGWVSVGIDHDTAAFAVNSIRQ